MNEQKFTELLGHIDPALIARAENPVPMRQKPIFRRALIAAVAAMLALTMCASLIIIPFIPTTLGLDYLTSPSDGTETAFKEQNAWIYYVENGKQKREYVRLPGDTQNVFLAWKHLNAVGDEVELLDYRFESDHAQATVVPDTLWGYLQQAFSPASGTVSVTLSPEITSCENYDTLIKSLTETLAKYAGVDPEQVKIMIDGEQSILAGGLKFYHNLQPDKTVIAGGQFDITVGMTNVSDYDIEFTGSWTDFAPKAKLRANTIVYVEQLLLPLPNDSTTEIAEYRLAPGESRAVTYSFDIPENAELGYYDLILSFGDAKMTFEGAVQVIASTVTSDEYLQFAEFLNNYGFTSASSTKFRWALDNFQYQGSNVFTHMNQADAEWAPGFSGEYWMGDFCEYVTMTFNSGSTAHMQKSIFYTTVLPDGVTLPANIYLDDSLFGALTKLGFSDQSVQSAILQSTDTILINTGSCYLGLRFENGYTSIDYCDTVQDGASTIVRQMQLRYNTATQKFFSLYVCTSSSNFSFPVTITRTNHGQAVNWKLSDEQSLRLLEAVNTGNWELDWPIRTDFTLSPTFSFNGDSMLFEETWFLDQGCAVEVSRSLVKELLDSFTLYEGMVAFDHPNDGVTHTATLFTEDQEQLLEILNHGNWQENTEDDIFVEFHLTVGTKSLHYNATSGTFWNEHFQQVLVLSEENRKTVNQILDGYMVELPVE